MTDELENLVLRQLQSIRREMAALLDQRAHDRDLISKVYNELRSLRSEMRELSPRGRR